MSVLPFYLLALIQSGGTTPAVGGFGYGAGLALLIMVGLIVGFVIVALFRAGRRKR